MRIHDLRHSFASVGVSGGASLPIIGKLLGLTKSSTTEKYSHLAADPIRAVNEAMGNWIAKMLSGLRCGKVKLHSMIGGHLSISHLIRIARVFEISAALLRGE